MATINKIRLTNVVYEEGDKRFNDEIFNFNGNNSAILLENGGGKTVLIHTVLQAVLPHTDLGERKIKDTLQLENAPAHIGIEWITSERPRRYVATVVTLYMYDNKLQSYKYVYEYEEGNNDRLEAMPFAKETADGKRPATKEEMAEYFSAMKSKSMNAAMFDTNKSFHEYIENNYYIVTNEWESIVKINRDEGSIEQFFDHCKTTTDLFDRLLIPTVEDSITGHEDGKFADIFEERREGFRMYRNFQNSMREYEMIQREITTYVDQFALYSETEAAYESTKQRAKAIALLLEKETEQIIEAKEEQETALQQWHEESNTLERKRASYDILREEATEIVLKKAYDEQFIAHEEAKETYEKNETERANLLYAKEKANLSIYKQQKATYEKELAKQDDAGTVEDLQTSLDEVDAQIHGYYMTKIEAHEQMITHAHLEQRPLRETKESIEETIAQKEHAKREVEKEFAETKGDINSNERQINNLKQRVLANPQQEDVRTQYEKWSRERTHLDEAIIKATNFIHIKRNEKTEVAAAIERSRKQLDDTKKQLHKKIYDNQQLDNTHDKTIVALAEVRPVWQGLDDLYLKESSILGTLADMKQERLNKREAILLKERLARRFTDDYGTQSHFFTDPFLYEKIADWQHHLFVQTGTQYIDNLQEAEREAVQTYQLWPLTIVTIEANKHEIEQKISAIKDKLQHPVIILTIEQAKEISTLETNDGTWITPTYWETNIDETIFADWKAKMSIEAEETINERKVQDQLVAEIEQVIATVTQFFTTYPKETKDALREMIHELQREVAKNELDMTTLIETSSQIEIDITNAEKEITEKKDKLQGIEQRLKDANDIFQLERTIHTLTEKQAERTSEIETYEREIAESHRAKARYEADIALLQEGINDNRQAINVIQAGDLYKEVNSTRPQFTDNALEIMRERRTNIQLEIHGIEREYREVRVKLDIVVDAISRTEDEMTEIASTYDVIDETVVFPVDGESKLERLRDAMHEDKRTIEQLNIAMNEAKSAYDQQKGTVRTKKEQFTKQFPGRDMNVFMMEIEKIEPYLTEKQQTLTERKRYIEARLQQIKKEQKIIEAADRKLENFKEAHHFHQTNVTASDLTEQEKTEFQYNRISIVTEITDTLTENRTALEKEKANIDHAKRKFRSFCRKHITDRQLQETAVEGMETKDTYEEILAYKENMFIRLESANKYARDFIADNDRHIQAFINNIHNHLLNVTEELKVIPKKTRVKVADKSRDIYQFSIPEWKEEDGKARIREHLDWILSQLEHDHFKNERGQEDTGKVRKQVETWLQTKSLLQVVMQNEKMRVSCRKVTNDNQVSSRLTSWEQSNQWSGGEKWSKNMTLFLGILNFVAEKKHYINAKMKRNRAVILDNPFGKASSDHVLNPVFFIAEQLGFQIIALTAHADGKFLQDYFPIIYSLKLRETSAEGKLVMTKTRSLHHAYFEDHAPEELERLEEREQLGFDFDEE